MTLLTLLRSVACRVTRKFPDTLTNHDQNISEQTFDVAHKEECRPPSPKTSFTDADALSSVLTRLVELEEKVDTLRAKPTEMPYEKEELLNAAVCRVDALEAELIATKKVSTTCLVFLLGKKKTYQNRSPFTCLDHVFAEKLRLVFNNSVRKH